MSRVTGAIMIALGQFTILVVSLNWTYSWTVGWILFAGSICEVLVGIYLLLAGGSGKERA